MNSNADNSDEWQKALNDNKFIINKKISKMFPYMRNPQHYLKLQIDPESYNYITHRDIAEIITKIIFTYCVKENINPSTQTIVDFTAGVGGNVLSFAKYFKRVVGIEICPNRVENLKNNIDVYGYTCCEVICGSSLDYKFKETDNLVFIDPPWGGVSYKEQSNLTLSLGDVPIENVVTTIFNENPQVRLVGLKLPKNYDLEFFCNNVENDGVTITVWILRKMFLIIVTRKPT